MQLGAIVLVAGMILIGICHLPIAFKWRVAIIIAVMAVCASLRAGWLTTPMPTIGSVAIPVLAAMFMFRLAIYLYDLRFDDSRRSIWETLSYFFLLPNVCFLLFPVVDYKTFRRTYYDKPAHDIYQKGLLWMMRGVVHLLIYRTVYYYFTLSPSDVTDLGTAVHYMVSTYMLYLHISGQFHLIVGILCLFGFNLPETHNLFYLASGFSDYWRRINIYWKDFMMQMFYYPVLMRVRVLGVTTGIAIATLVVFFGTWVLHAYQWFWLRGDFLLTATDASFWGILGVLVVLNSVIETKFRRKKKRLNAGAWDFFGALVHSLKVLGMLVTITVLWTLWNSHTFADFFDVLSAAASDNLQSWIIFFTIIAVLLLIGVLVQYLKHSGVVFTEAGSAPSPTRSAISTGLISLFLIVLAGGFPFYANFDERTEAIVLSLSTERLNDADQDTMEAGYYEGLLDMGGYTSALARAQGRQPADWKAPLDSHARRYREDVVDYELLPLAQDIVKMVDFSTNRWGMRDKDYELAKPAGTYRIALLGASYNVAAGVEQDESFEAIVEQRLNATPPQDSKYDSYEILNFSVGGYSLLQQAALIESRVAGFSPDVVLLTVHTSELRRLRIRTQSIVTGRKEIPYPEVSQAIQNSGAHPEMRSREMTEALESITENLEEWAIGEIARDLQAAGIKPIAVFIPETIEYQGVDIARRDRLKTLFEQVGFSFLELDNPYVTDDIRSLQLAEWDTHPNVEGHRRIADNLYDMILENPQVFMLEGDQSVSGGR